MAFHFGSSSVWAVVSVLAVSSSALAQRPNSLVTPGAKTKANEAQICAAGYAASVKPIAGWQKAEALKRYGVRPEDFPGDVDFLIPISLGGSADPDNLWPQAPRKEFGPDAKDKLEDVLHAMVCDKKLSLKQAQDAIKKDWIKAYEQYVTNAQ